VINQQLGEKEGLFFATIDFLRVVGGRCGFGFHRLR